MAAGLDPAQFWGQTPASYRTHMAGVEARLRREATQARALAWHSAALARTAKLPDFRQYVTGAPKRRQSVDEMYAIARGMTAFFEGVHARGSAPKGTS